MFANASSGRKRATCLWRASCYLYICALLALPIILVFCFKQSDVPTITSGADGIVATACHDDADTVVTGAFGCSIFLNTLVRMTTQPP